MGVPVLVGLRIVHRHKLRDNRRARTYTPCVSPDTTAASTPAPRTIMGKTGRRRAATGHEQARRKAWGKAWGGRISAFWRAQHAREQSQQTTKGARWVR